MFGHFNWIFIYFLKAAVCILSAYNGMFNMFVWGAGGWSRRLWAASAGAACLSIPRIACRWTISLAHRQRRRAERRTRKVAGCDDICDGRLMSWHSDNHPLSIFTSLLRPFLDQLLHITASPLAFAFTPILVTGFACINDDASSCVSLQVGLFSSCYWTS